LPAQVPLLPPPCPCSNPRRAPKPPRPSATTRSKLRLPTATPPEFSVTIIFAAFAPAPTAPKPSAPRQFKRVKPGEILGICLTSYYYLLHSLLVFSYRYSRAALTPLDSALTSKRRVLPVFSRNHSRVTCFPSALTRRSLHNSFRMRTSRKQGEGGLPPNSIAPSKSRGSLGRRKSLGAETRVLFLRA
jgi:hypothetical protein